MEALGEAELEPTIWLVENVKEWLGLEPQESIWMHAGCWFWSQSDGWDNNGWGWKGSLGMLGRGGIMISPS